MAFFRWLLDLLGLGAPASLADLDRQAEALRRGPIAPPPPADGGGAAPPRSGWLIARPSPGNPDRLRQRGLPVCLSVAALATAMERSERELWWLADPLRHQGGDGPNGRATSPHYRLLLMKKRGGGERPVMAPRMHLKAAQRWILRNILDKVGPHPAAHGFRRGRSIRSHAGTHVGRTLVLQVDLEHFFHQFTYRQAKGIFCGLGYPRPVGMVLALLCTAGRAAIEAAARAAGRPPEVVVGMFGQRRRGPRGSLHPHLMQGAPTSPALANLLARGLDVRLSALAARFGATYTRYADDCAFSGGPDFRASLRRFWPLLRRVCRAEGFALVPRKTRFARAGARQQVTGLVVNRVLNVPREEYRRLRALLHEAGARGPSVANRAAHPDFRAHVLGRIAHVAAANPARGATLRAAFDRVAW
jgi:hypothetical protein